MPFSTRTMRPEDWAEITHFGPDEFKYPDRMGYEFMRWLDNVRHEAGVPMHPISDHRPPPRNRAAGGANRSAHLAVPCDSVDIKPRNNYERFQIVFAAYNQGCRRFGIYITGSVHLDRAEDELPAPRLWTKRSA